MTAGDDPSTTEAPKISMKGFSLKSNNKSKPDLTTGEKTILGKRPRSALTSTHHSDSEDDYERNGRHEEVTGFDASAGGAVRAGQEAGKKGPLVIERIKNRDWRNETRMRTQGKNLLPKEVQEQRARQTNTNGMTEMEEDIKWGLTITKTKVSIEEGENGDGMVLDTQMLENEVGNPPSGDGDAVMKPAQTEDEIALDALLGKGPKAPDLIIHRNSNGAGAANLSQPQSPQGAVPANETDAYRLAVASAPEVSTLDEYERIPVADFGAALLRGMGWKGETSTPRRKEVKRRPNLLGLGAKELGDAEELGAWVQKADAKRLRPGGGGGDKRGSGFVKPSDYKREKERDREERDSRRERGGGGRRESDWSGDRRDGGGGRDPGRYSNGDSKRDGDGGRAPGRYSHDEREKDREPFMRNDRYKDYRRR